MFFRFSIELIYACYLYRDAKKKILEYLRKLCLVCFETNALTKNSPKQLFYFSFQNLLAEMYYYGKRGLQRDLNRAVKYYQMGADKGDAEGLYNLGVSMLKVSNKVTDTVRTLVTTERKISNIAFYNKVSI